MRSTRNAVLVAGALASGSLPGLGTTSALAQGFGGNTTTGGGFYPGYPTSPPAGTNGMSGYPASPPAGMSGANAAPRTVYATPSSNPMGAGGAAPSPYGTSPGLSPTSPGDAAVRAAYARPVAPSPNPIPGVPTAMYPPGPPDANSRPAPSPAGAPAGAASNPNVKPYLASVPSPADAPKPKGMRKIWSYLWHGGSSSEAESKPTYYDYSTGRTDLMNARPWMKPASTK